MSIDTLLNRRSVRDYTDQPISDADLKLLLRAGLYAPSSKNAQPWEFVVIRNKNRLTELSHVVKYWSMLSKASLAIVVLANTEGYNAPDDVYVQDCSAATENILIAAECLGLGAVWLGLYGEPMRMTFVRTFLGLPAPVLPFSVISIGVPVSHPKPHSSFRMEKIHYERFGAISLE